MHEVAFSDTQEDVYIQTRQEADLFNEAHFKSKNQSVFKVVRELLFADDSIPVAHTPNDIQVLMDRFVTASKQFCRQINTKNTEWVYQHSKFPSDVSLPTIVSINKKPLLQCKTTIF